MDNWQKLLSEHGHKITGARCAVMRVLEESQVPLSPQEVAERGQTYHPQLGVVTAYRTLELFESLGLVHRIHQPDACHGFVLAEPGHRHSLVCRTCGRTIIFTGCDALDRLIRELEATTGYVIEDHLLQFSGVCQACRQARDGQNCRPD